MIQRNTVQRKKVLDAVQQMNNHPTAEDIYGYLSEQKAGLGRATIYRNLGVLCDQGMVRKIEVPDAPDRFDHTLYAHYHLSCRRCNTFIDVEVPVLAKLNRSVSKETGFEDIDHDIVFYGLCPECQKKKAIPRH